jgi:hypothetical protein
MQNLATSSNSRGPLLQVLFLPLWELKPPFLLRLNHGQNQNKKTKRVRAGSESEGKAPGGDISGGYEDGDEGKDSPRKLLGDGGQL